jgi:putative DNA primase/helicase
MLGRDGLILTRLSDVVPEEIRWLWPRRWPLGKFSLVVGEGDLGKSQLFLDAMARISRGDVWPDGG